MVSKLQKPADKLLQRKHTKGRISEYVTGYCSRMERSASERTALRRFGDSGMMLLPWTKQILTVVWEQLRLLVQVICCTLMTGNFLIHIFALLCMLSICLTIAGLHNGIYNIDALIYNNNNNNNNISAYR